MAYSRFLDSLTQCLLKTTTAPTELQLALKRNDTPKVIGAISKQLGNLITGEMSVYKNSFETIGSQLYGVGLQMVHEVMLAESKSIHILEA